MPAPHQAELLTGTVANMTLHQVWNDLFGGKVSFLAQ